MSGGITIIIVIATAIASLGAFNDQSLLYKLMYSPYRAKRGEWYRIISHAFVHADSTHLFINMFVLWMFGTLMESTFDVVSPGNGKMLFMGLYFGGVLFASIPAMVKHSDNDSYWSLGASGAVSAVIFSYVLFYPTEVVYLFFVIPIPAILFGILYLVYEYYMDKRGRGNVAHDAHFWGALFGIIFVLILDPNTTDRLQRALNQLF